MNPQSLKFKKKTPTLTDPPSQTFQETIIYHGGKTSYKKRLILVSNCPFFSVLDVASLHSGSNIPSTAIAEDVLSEPPEKLLDSNLKPEFRLTYSTVFVWGQHCCLQNYIYKAMTLRLA